MRPFSEPAYLQIPLPLQTAACPRCPLRRDGRCEGVGTLESFIQKDESSIGCYDADRIRIHYDDVRRSRSGSPPPCHHDRLELPSFIPVIKDGGPQDACLGGERLYAVSFSTLLRESGDLRFAAPGHLRKTLGLPHRARLALICTVDDRRIERFWKISEEREMWRRVADLDFEFVTSATFSVWNRSPRSDQIISQEKNFVTHDDLCALGVPSVPFLFFYVGSELDYRQLLAHLRARPDVSKVAMLAQLRRATVSFGKVIEYMRAIKRDVGRPLHFVVVGAAAASKVDRVFREFPDSTIVTDQPFMKGNFGWQTLEDLSHVKNEAASRGQLVRDNIAQFQRYCEWRGNHLPHPSDQTD